MFSIRRSHAISLVFGNALTRINYSIPQPIIDVLMFYGARLDPNHKHFLDCALCNGKFDIDRRNMRSLYSVDSLYVLASANIEVIKYYHADRARRAYDLERGSSVVDLGKHTVQSLELLMELNIIQCGKQYQFKNIPSFNVLQWILDKKVMKLMDVLIDIARNASRYSGHYFDMLRYLIEQRKFKVPRNILVAFRTDETADLGVFDFLLFHGAALRTDNVEGRNVLECSPLLTRYWIDKGLVMQPNDANALTECVSRGMSVHVLEMIIVKFKMNVNAKDTGGFTALHRACRRNDVKVVEMLIKHGANMYALCMGTDTPHDLAATVKLEQLLISHGYVPGERCNINCGISVFRNNT